MAGTFFRQSPGFAETYPPHLVSSVLGSDHFGPSVLGAEFIDTSGLSIVFRRDHLDTVHSHFPYLTPLLDHVLFDASNAFYVNPLVLDINSEVAAHIDCRYIQETGTRILPTVVSVFYAEIDERMEGGELVFVTDDGDIAVKPHTNEIVHFVGSARHYISKIMSPSRRVSVVVEQYNLEDDSLCAFPECHLVRDDALSNAPTRNPLI